jgi:hypothetical protein
MNALLAGLRSRPVLTGQVENSCHDLLSTGGREVPGQYPRIKIFAKQTVNNTLWLTCFNFAGILQKRVNIAGTKLLSGVYGDSARDSQSLPL